MSTINKRVNIYINGDEATGSIRDIQKAYTRLNNDIKRSTVGSEEYNEKVKELRKLRGVLDDHRKRVRPMASLWENITGAVSKFAVVAAGAFSVREIARFGKELFALGSEMELLNAKAVTVFGEAMPLVTDQARRNSLQMGLTTSQYIDAAAAIQDLLIPMGFQRDSAAEISTELVNLSGALSEWTGGQVSSEQAANILSKALLGEREQLKTLGISIKEADVQTRLAEKGMKDLTGQMLEQAKAAATLELITEKTTDAQAAFSENTESLVRSQAEYTAKMREVREVMANALMPVWRSLSQQQNFLASGVLNLANRFADLMNPVERSTQAFKDQQAQVDRLETDFVPLLDRYDELQNKSELNVAEQAELESIIDKVRKIVPQAVTEFDEYGKALGINTDRAREFVQAQNDILLVRNAEAISENRKQLASLEAEHQRLMNTLNGVAGGYQDVVRQGDEFFRRVMTGGVNARIELQKMSEEEVAGLHDNFALLNRQIRGTKGILEELTGEDLGIASMLDGLEEEINLSPTDAEIAEQQKQAELLAEQRTKQREKEAAEREREQERIRQELERHYQRLSDAREKFEEEQYLASLSDSDRALEEIRISYQKQIDEVVSLSQQMNERVAELMSGNLEDERTQAELEALRERMQELTAFRLQLEQAQSADINNLRQELGRQAFEEEQARLRTEEAEALIAKEQHERDKAEFLKELERELYGEDPLQAEIEAIQAHYEQLIALAESYGIDTVALRQKMLDQMQAATQDFYANEIEQAARQMNVLGNAFSSLGQAASSAMSEAGEEVTGLVAIQKFATLAQMAFDTASAISSVVAAASVSSPDPITLAARIASGIAIVLGNITTARRMFNEAPAIPQKKEGRWLNVKGADDGRTYSAKYIGKQDSGMLPSTPVVLASEEGPEYFVANHHLRNPAVFDHVRAIENIVSNQPLRQFATGGFTEDPEEVQPQDIAAPPESQPTPEAIHLFNTLNATIQQLNAILSRGIPAIVGNDATLDIVDNFNRLDRQSGQSLSRDTAFSQKTSGGGRR